MTGKEEVLVDERGESVVYFAEAKQFIRCCGSKVEHVTRNDGVVGSIPTNSTTIMSNPR